MQRIIRTASLIEEPVPSVVYTRVTTQKRVLKKEEEEEDKEKEEY